MSAKQLFAWNEMLPLDVQVMDATRPSHTGSYERTISKHTNSGHGQLF